MFKGKLPLVLLIGIVFLLSFRPVHPARVPIPEDYGIYVVIGGRLEEMHSYRSNHNYADILVKNVGERKPSFVVYAANIPRVYLYRATTKWIIPSPANDRAIDEEVELRFTPINDNHTMLKITPRYPLSPGNYYIGLVADNWYCLNAPFKIK